MSIGDRIREFALSRYNSVSELARQLNMSPSNLLAYVSNKREPGAKLLLKLHYLGADIAWILSGEKKERSLEISLVLKKYNIKSAKQLTEILDFFVKNDGLTKEIKELIAKRFNIY